MTEINRTVLLKTLTGSHNYNLQEEGSDKDYKVFTLPTFEDLYKGHFYKHNTITDTVDMDIKDIRQLPDLLWKANISYLELLFSKDVEMYDCPELRRLFELREDIVRMNLPQLFKSTGGMFNQRMKKLYKATDGTQHLVVKHGYNTKEAMHTTRTLEALIRYANSGFTDFANAIWYEGEKKDIMLSIKNGLFTGEVFEDFINDVHNICFAPLKERFYAHEPNFELKKYIDSLIMELVQSKISPKF